EIHFRRGGIVGRIRRREAELDARLVVGMVVTRDGSRWQTVGAEPTSESVRFLSSVDVNVRYDRTHREGCKCGNCLTIGVRYKVDALVIMVCCVSNEESDVALRLRLNFFRSLYFFFSSR